MAAGAEVAVKVQRPGLEELIPLDMYILRQAAVRCLSLSLSLSRLSPSLSLREETRERERDRQTDRWGMGVGW